MLRPEPDVAVLVAFLVIPAQGPAARVRGFLVEPDRREQPSSRLDTTHSRALALVLDRLRPEARCLDVVSELVSRQMIRSLPVVGKDAQGIPVTTRSQPTQMRG